MQEVRFDASFWPAEQKGTFESSDEDLNAIWKTAVATLRSNMHDFYLDGIRRDGLLWHDGPLTLEAYERVFFDADLSRQTLIGETLPERPTILDVGIIDARARAGAEGLNVRFLEGDAEALPFKDGSFDVVVSLIGAVFASRPDLVARELLRVCRHGVTIAMGNWTPEGFVGQTFRTFATFIAPSGMPAPVLWGDEKVVRERVKDGASDLRMTRRQYYFGYPLPPSETVELFRRFYGPTNRSFQSPDERSADKLRDELEALWATHNRAGDDLTFVAAGYLEVVAVRA